MSRLQQLFTLLEQNPKDSFVRFALAKEFENTGDQEKALEFYTHLLKDDPDYVGAYFHLAQLYVEHNQTGEAMKIYDNGIAVAKKLSDHHALSELQAAKTNLEMEDLMWSNTEIHTFENQKKVSFYLEPLYLKVQRHPAQFPLSFEQCPFINF